MWAKNRLSLIPVSLNSALYSVLSLILCSDLKDRVNTTNAARNRNRSQSIRGTLLKVVAYLQIERFPESVQFLRSIAIVMGPTPPGTGVICEATCFAPSKSQSPTSLYPAFLVASSTALVPTSMITAPGLIHSFLTICAWPQHAIMMSAVLTTASGFGVREWTMVVVASALFRSMAAGIPTILLRPTTTAFFPEISTPERLRSSMQPLGVQGTKSGSRPFMQRRPIFRGWKPSTSFSMLISASTAASSICFGIGSCTRIP
mmetsp:Transcript_38594/g.46686  ORF Transcript_38594/g.46686 Transcript_38594/m.46686 type:complete len:260 (+) Transcript_38594:83-862(+)